MFFSSAALSRTLLIRSKTTMSRHFLTRNCFNLPTMQKQIISSPSLRLFSESSSLNENELIEFVEGKVFEVLKSAAKCKHEKLARTATFEDLGFDSLDGVELVLAMEEHFGFEITNNEAEKITSVMDAIQIFHTNVLKRQSLET